MIINRKSLSAITILWTLLAICNRNVLAISAEEDVAVITDLPSSETPTPGNITDVIESGNLATDPEIDGTSTLDRIPESRSNHAHSSDQNRREKRSRRFLARLFGGRRHDEHSEPLFITPVQTYASVPGAATLQFPPQVAQPVYVDNMNPVPPPAPEPEGVVLQFFPPTAQPVYVNQMNPVPPPAPEPEGVVIQFSPPAAQLVYVDDADRCLQNHAFCMNRYYEDPLSIFNRYRSTASCECDDPLYRCLWDSPEPRAKEVGKQYFSDNAESCMVYDIQYRCARRMYYLNYKERCGEYERVPDGTPMYQFRSNKFFVSDNEVTFL